MNNNERGGGCVGPFYFLGIRRLGCAPTDSMFPTVPPTQHKPFFFFSLKTTWRGVEYPPPHALCKKKEEGRGGGFFFSPKSSRCLPVHIYRLIPFFHVFASFLFLWFHFIWDVYTYVWRRVCFLSKNGTCPNRLPFSFSSWGNRKKRVCCSWKKKMAQFFF